MDQAFWYIIDNGLATNKSYPFHTKVSILIDAVSHQSLEIAINSSVSGHLNSEIVCRLLIKI